MVSRKQKTEKQREADKQRARERRAKRTEEQKKKDSQKLKEKRDCDNYRQRKAEAEQLRRETQRALQLQRIDLQPETNAARAATLDARIWRDHHHEKVGVHKRRVRGQKRSDESSASESGTSQGCTACHNEADEKHSCDSSDIDEADDELYMFCGGVSF